MVPYLRIPSCESSVSMKENPGRKKMLLSFKIPRTLTVFDDAFRNNREIRIF